jgi:O-methyltransferase
MRLRYFIEKMIHKSGWVLSKVPVYYKNVHTTDSWTADYARISTLELIAQSLREKKITGSIAEVGVYKGKFAAKVNQVFPNNKFYLFDTFEGFHAKDIAIEKEKKLSDGLQDFSNTSVNIVLSKMKYPALCIIKKGYFPETATDINDNFIFVSLDTDLYQPILEGLQFFYPKLLKGGYIMIHDYNNPYYPGVKEAVHQYCFDNNIPFFPVPDILGSVVIAK